MARGKFDYPDLDDLFSPLSSSPLSSTTSSSLNGVPASAIAQSIFNDPDSWEGNDDDADAGVEDLPNDHLTSFDKSQASADVHGTFDLGAHDKRIPGFAPPAGGMQAEGTDWTSNIQPTSISISNVLDGNVRPLSPALTPTTFSMGPCHPLKINTSKTTGSTTDSISPIIIHSSSITLGFLDLYGMYSESDMNLRSLGQQYRKSINPRFANSMVSSRRNAVPPSPVTPPPQVSQSWSHTPTPSQPHSRSNPKYKLRSRSNSRSQLSTGISAQGASSRLSKGLTRRRLPSVPPVAHPPPSLCSTSAPSTESSVLVTQQQSPARPPIGPRKRANRQG